MWEEEKQDKNVEKQFKATPISRYLPHPSTMVSKVCNDKIINIDEKFLFSF